MAGDATVVEKDPKARRSIATLVLLEYPPSDKPLRFLIAGSRSVDKDDVGKKAEHGASAFFYEQHSCPTNWIGNAEVIAYDGNPDPHGFLRYVREIDRPDLPDECMEEDRAYFALFPELLSQEPIKPR
jgi:hypothetical protein